MAEEDEHIASVGSPGSIEEAERLDTATPENTGVFNRNTMIVHRDGRPILALVVQEFRMFGHPTKFRVKQVFPDVPNYLPIVAWFDTSEEAEIAAEEWVADNMDGIR